MCPLRRLKPWPTHWAAAIAVALAVVIPGCSSELAHPEGGSPIVHPDSPEAKKAFAESEKLLKLRQAQEAKAHRRNKAMPDEG